MSEENISLNEISESSDATPFPVRGWWRVWYGLFVIVFPIFSFWAIDALKPEWQSGNLEDYVVLLLHPKSSLIFFFLITYSVGCYIILLINSKQFASSFIIRFGVYAGALLALQYTILLGMFLLDNRNSFGFLLTWLFPIYFPRLYRWSITKWAPCFNRVWLIAIILIVYFIFAYSINNEALTPIVLLFVILVASAPFWSFLIAIQASVWLLKYHESKLTPHRLGVIAWIVTYMAAWRYDILKMYELYSQLPTEPPNCYIATAATHGHPAIVHSQEITIANGTPMRVNRQLQTLKCAELALLAVAPNLHRVLRKIYDVVGKRLAQHIRHPLAADVAYLGLKPFEWIARIGLRLIIGDVNMYASKMYSQNYR